MSGRQGDLICAICHVDATIEPPIVFMNANDVAHFECWAQAETARESESRRLAACAV